MLQKIGVKQRVNKTRYLEKHKEYRTFEFRTKDEKTLAPSCFQNKIHCTSTSKYLLQNVHWYDLDDFQRKEIYIRSKQLLLVLLKPPGRNMRVWFLSSSSVLCSTVWSFSYNEIYSKILNFLTFEKIYLYNYFFTNYLHGAGFNRFNFDLGALHIRILRFVPS